VSGVVNNMSRFRVDIDTCIKVFAVCFFMMYRDLLNAGVWN